MNNKNYIEMPRWIQKEIDLYNSRGPAMKLVTRLGLGYIIITILSHIRIIIL